MTKANELIPTRHSLLERLKRWDDQDSWSDFFETYWRLIYGVAIKAGLNDAEAQDVVQETIIDVARKIPDFHYDPSLGTFKAWLMRLTRWRIADHFRGKRYEEAGQRKPREQPLNSAFLEQQPDPSSLDLEAIWNEEWEKHVLDIALNRIRQQVSPSQYQMFHLHVINQVPARQVAQRLGVKLAEVYIAKYKLMSRARQTIRRLEERMT